MDISVQDQALRALVAAAKGFDEANKAREVADKALWDHDARVDAYLAKANVKRDELLEAAREPRRRAEAAGRARISLLARVDKELMTARDKAQATVNKQERLVRTEEAKLIRARKDLEIAAKPLFGRRHGKRVKIRKARFDKDTAAEYARGLDATEGDVLVYKERLVKMRKILAEAQAKVDAAHKEILNGSA